MALMPEDLMNQRFTPVRFSEGYDMDEVDNFLDHEVEPRLKELIAENERLKTELEEAHNRIAELEAGAPAASPVAADTTGEGEAVIDGVPTSPAEQSEVETTGPQAVVAEAPAEEPAPSAAPAEPAPDQSAAGIIALANRLHDEYVKNGEDERDRLIHEANEEHRRIVGEAEEKSRATLAALETEKAELDRTIESLRNFERDYRNRLRNYLENQLRELDTSETQDKQANLGL
ncbi:DivIVA domain-containing protein [Brachybacterium sp. UNK5269]|uniref:DivIVA domain-containing protein n=1 Tax=Brachybacterium sp. UNK5269 TaxID=3408576 RepID=UPI003BB022E1